MGQDGKKITVWFTYNQLQILEEIKKLNPDINNSLAVREGLKLLLKSLRSK
jgi:hypothetical protein